KILMHGLMSAVSLTLVAANPSVPDKYTNSFSGYIENKGQVIDQYHHPNPAVKYLFNSNGLNIQLRADGFSYDTYTIERKSSSNPKKEGPFSGPTRDEDILYHFHRVDIEF